MTTNNPTHCKQRNNHLPQATCSDALVCLLWISSGMDLNRGTQSENRNNMFKRTFLILFEQNANID